MNIILIYDSAERERFINESLSKNNSTNPISEYVKVDYYVLHCLINTISKECVFDIKYNKYGKPYLSQNQNLYFNISNSNKKVCIGISDRPIGIDLEYIKPRNLKAMMKFLNASELQYINSSISAEYAFYEIWTIKEAYLKYLGVGLNKPLKSVEIIPYEFSYLVKDRGEAVNLHFNSFLYDRCYYRVSVCSESVIPNKLIKLDNLSSLVL